MYFKIGVSLGNIDLTQICSEKIILPIINLNNVALSDRTLNIAPMSLSTGQAVAGGGQGQVHKLIMVGSGGVGKSALTLQFMYDEVG